MKFKEIMAFLSPALIIQANSESLNSEQIRGREERKLDYTIPNLRIAETA